jgi:predicted nucleotidyltransferase
VPAVSANRFARVLDSLARHDVRFIVVGGVAAVLQRVPVNTLDFDIVHDRRPDNVECLLAALAELDAVYRDDPRRLRPNESHLLGAGAQLLRTERLDFDVLGSIDGGKSYDDLLPDTDLIEVAGRTVRVLTLEKLIDVKRRLTRPKDKFMLLHLEATLDERTRKKSGSGEKPD